MYWSNLERLNPLSTGKSVQTTYPNSIDQNVRVLIPYLQGSLFRLNTMSFSELFGMS